MRPERAYAPAARASAAHDPSRVLIIGCGALARELVAVIDQAGLSNVDLTCLPATLHNRPGGIPAAVRAKIQAARPRYERIFIAYADCGTGGLLDRMLAGEGVERLPGAHCYELYAGAATFAAITDADPATFFLTDFLARNFDRLVITGLGLDRHPELLPVYFGNYHRLIYLAQTDDPALVATARRAARRLGLAFELRRTGYGELGSGIIGVAGPATAAEAGAARGVTAGGAAPAAAKSPGAAPAAATSPRATRSVAVGASKGTTGSGRAPETDDSLRPEQERGLPGPASGGMLRQEQGSPPSRPASRRCLRPVQRRGDSLPGSQHAGSSTEAA